MANQRTLTPNRLMIRLALALGLLLIFALLLAVAALPSAPTSAQDDSTPTPTAPPPPLVELNETIIKQATVLIMQTYQSGPESIISCVGSGTLVSADGLILTNAHIALPSATCRSDQIVIAVTVRLDEPPIPIYSASVVDSSTGSPSHFRHTDPNAVRSCALSLPSTRCRLASSICCCSLVSVE